MQERNLKEDFENIRRVLFEEWDPIGINSNINLYDEYNDYILRIHNACLSRSQKNLIDLLSEIEQKEIGLYTTKQKKYKQQTRC